MVASSSTLLELRSDLISARQDAKSDTLTLRFNPRVETDCRRRLRAMSAPGTRFDVDDEKEASAANE